MSRPVIVTLSDGARTADVRVERTDGRAQHYVSTFGVSIAVTALAEVISVTVIREHHGHDTEAESVIVIGPIRRRVHFSPSRAPSLPFEILVAARFADPAPTTAETLTALVGAWLSMHPDKRAYVATISRDVALALDELAGILDA